MFPQLKSIERRKAQKKAAGVVRSTSQVEKLAKLTGNNYPQIITEQLVAHLRTQGINAYDQAAMVEFLKTHDIRSLQQMVEMKSSADRNGKLISLCSLRSS